MTKTIMDLLDEDQLLFLAGILLLRRKKQRFQRKYHVHPLWRQRKEKGAHDSLLADIVLHDELMFQNYVRMTVTQYEDLLLLVGPDLLSYQTREDTISPFTKLMITVRYLATGESLSSLHDQFRLGKSTAQNCIFNTLEILWKKLQPLYLCFPGTPEEWKTIATGYESKWQFPHYWGAVDGKQVLMQAQPNSGSENYNHKHQHSVNLLAVCDSDYNFIMIDVGARGRESDRGVFKRNSFGKKLFNQGLNLPAPDALYPGGPILPYFAVADEAFPLHVNIMRPFPGRASGRLSNNRRIFNYRLSRARRVIENTFGILASKWRIFRQPIDASEDHIKLIVAGSTVLHNYIRKTKKFTNNGRNRCNDAVQIEDLDPDVQLGAFAPLQQRLNVNLGAVRVRQCLADYFETDGSMPWQQERINEGFM